MMYKTFLVLTLLTNLIYGFDEPDDYSDYQESVANDIPQEIMEGFEEAISEKNATTKNQLTLDDWLQEMLQWLQANLHATILIGVGLLVLPVLIAGICWYLKKDQMILQEVEMQQIQ